MEKNYKISKIGCLYIPKPIHEDIGRRVKLVDAPGAVLVFSQGVHIKRVLKSLKILAMDLEHRNSGELELEQGSCGDLCLPTLEQIP